MLRVERVRRAFDGKPVLRGVDLNVGQGEIVCLLGPSGCGKTTLLRIISGLETLDSGDIQLDETSIIHVPVHERDFGLMFQDFALFPHMNVAQNVAFGLRMHRRPKSEIDVRVGEMLGLVGLDGFERRDVNSLSGGERQRVALARSLAPSPRLLMLDEPLGSLDAALRERLVIDLRAIIKQVGLTAVYVTHDQQEAFAIADRMAIMNTGLIEQVDAPERVYRQPKTEFAARFLGLDNILPVLEQHEQTVTTPLGQFNLPSIKQAAKILIHSLDVRLVDGDRADTISGILTKCVFAGDSYKVEMRHQSGMSLTFQIPGYSGSIPNVGERVDVEILGNMVLPLIVNSA